MSEMMWSISKGLSQQINAPKLKDLILQTSPIS